MATCYDCIHCEACSDAGDSGFSSLKEDVSKCKHFKNKADVVEVKHGEWFLLDDCANEGVYCSVCRKKVYKKCYANQKLKSMYCPNCGAKMSVNYKSSKNER